jgi:hypothetical protein
MTMKCEKSTPRIGICAAHRVPYRYSERWDAYFCPVTNQWLEPECGCDESECEYVGRPGAYNGDE